MTFLSVNVNKFALIRNARDADLPNLYNISKKCIEYGADGITVHPRPDERHAKFSDLKLSLIHISEPTRRRGISDGGVWV